MKLIVLFIFILTMATSLKAEEPPLFEPDFYAFRNALSFGNLQKQSDTLKELGYNGMSQTNLTGDVLEELSLIHI